MRTDNRAAQAQRLPARSGERALAGEVRGDEGRDLLIFNSLLAHGIRPNSSADTVRLAQYISFAPAHDADAALREERVRAW